MKPGRWGGKAIDGHIEEAAAETPCGPEPNTTMRALDPGLPVEAPLSAALQAGAPASLGTQLTSTTSHVKGLEERQVATEQREAARDGGARAAWPAAILNLREGGRMAERPHLLRRPVAGQTSDGWKTLCGVSLIEARHGFRLSRETEPASPVLGCEKCASYCIAAVRTRALPTCA